MPFREIVTIYSEISTKREHYAWVKYKLSNGKV